jgi:hypothetical protein
MNPMFRKLNNILSTTAATAASFPLLEEVEVIGGTFPSIPSTTCIANLLVVLLLGFVVNSGGSCL